MPRVWSLSNGVFPFSAIFQSPGLRHALIIEVFHEHASMVLMSRDRQCSSDMTCSRAQTLTDLRVVCMIKFFLYITEAVVMFQIEMSDKLSFKNYVLLCISLSNMTSLETFFKSRFQLRGTKRWLC